MWWLDLYPNWFAHHTPRAAFKARADAAREEKWKQPASARWSVPAARRDGRGFLSPEGIDVTSKKWPTAFPPLHELADDDAYAKALECHVLGYSEYLAALIYSKDGQIPRELAYVPVKLVEDLKIRIDQTIIECLARMKAQNTKLQNTIDKYEHEADSDRS